MSVMPSISKAVARLRGKAHTGSSSLHGLGVHGHNPFNDGLTNRGKPHIIRLGRDLLMLRTTGTSDSRKKAVAGDKAMEVLQRLPPYGIEDDPFFFTTTQALRAAIFFGHTNHEIVAKMIAMFMKHRYMLDAPSFVSLVLVLKGVDMDATTEIFQTLVPRYLKILPKMSPREVALALNAYDVHHCLTDQLLSPSMEHFLAHLDGARPVDATIMLSMYTRFHRGTNAAAMVAATGASSPSKNAEMHTLQETSKLNSGNLDATVVGRIVDQICSELTVSFASHYTGSQGLDFKTVDVARVCTEICVHLGSSGFASRKVLTTIGKLVRENLSRFSIAELGAIMHCYHKLSFNHEPLMRRILAHISQLVLEDLQSMKRVADPCSHVKSTSSEGPKKAIDTAVDEQIDKDFGVQADDSTRHNEEQTVLPTDIPPGPVALSRLLSALGYFKVGVEREDTGTNFPFRSDDECPSAVASGDIPQKKELRSFDPTILRHVKPLVAFLLEGFVIGREMKVARQSESDKDDCMKSGQLFHTTASLNVEPHLLAAVMRSVSKFGGSFDADFCIVDNSRSMSESPRAVFLASSSNVHKFGSCAIFSSKIMKHYISACNLKWGKIATGKKKSVRTERLTFCVTSAVCALGQVVKATVALNPGGGKEMSEVDCEAVHVAIVDGLQDLLRFTEDELLPLIQEWAHRYNAGDTRQGVMSFAKTWFGLSPAFQDALRVLLNTMVPQKSGSGKWRSVDADRITRILDSGVFMKSAVLPPVQK